MNWQDKLRAWSQVDCVRFAVWCARRVILLAGDDKVIPYSLEMAEAWLVDPSEDNAQKAFDAAVDAIRIRAGGTHDTDLVYYAWRSAGYAADAAYTAALAKGTDGVGVVHHASYAASYAAHYAAAALALADASKDCDDDMNSDAKGPATSDLLDIYLSEMVMSEISSFNTPT